MARGHVESSDAVEAKTNADDAATTGAATSAATSAATKRAAGSTGVAGRAKFQVVVYECASCGAGKQLGAGVKFDIDAADVARAHCDAEHVSALAPGSVTQDIPGKVRRFVELRDGNRCRIPGCRSTRCLELHHIVHQEDGGTHEPENLVSICDGHHAAHHRDRLWIGGTATNLVVHRADEQPIATDTNLVVHRADEQPITNDTNVEAGAAQPTSRVGEMDTRSTAQLALESLGWKPRIARAAVDAAIAELGPELALDPLIRAALQRCR
jgi:hypothetical protein